jgi:branched-chain amino acid transport system substrate-binding protein
MSRAALAGLSVAAVAAVAGCGGGGKAPIRIGVLGVCQGVFAPLYDQVVAGADLPLLQRGGKLSGEKPADGVSGAIVSGHRIELFYGCSDETGERALAEVRRLVEKEHVQILVGAETSAAGVAIRDYAKTKPDVTFSIALSPTAETTLSTPAPNVFRFTTHALQWTAGLGTYAYRTLGWRRAIVVGNDFSYPYDEAAGFIAEFCSLGGHVVKRIWAEAGPPPIKETADGYFITVFLPQYVTAAVGALPLRGPLGRRILLGAAGITYAADALGARAVGVVGGSGNPIGSSAPAWTRLRAEYRRAFPNVPFTAFVPSFYDAMEAPLRGLEKVDGNLSDGGARFRTALAGLDLDLPTGHVRLDAHRQAIAPNYLQQVQRGPSGGYTLRTIRTVESVDDSYAGRFAPGKPLPSRTRPACTRGNPPPWVR